VRGRFRESERVERPPHPTLLHSPSETGVNALMARGEKEEFVARALARLGLKLAERLRQLLR